jgi:hypothetical protein
LAGLAVACTSDATGPAAVASVHVTPPNAQTQIGATVHLVAMPRDAGGADLPGRAIAWSSGDPGIATVSPAGVVTGVTIGSTLITATSEGKSGQATVAVVAGPATQLVFTVPPGSVTAGAAFTPALEVTARDALGNVATGFTGTVTLALAANPGGATLGGPASVTAVAGVASFPGVSLDKSGSGYTLAASAAGLTAATSAAFAVMPGAAHHVAFLVQPTPTVAGAVITPTPQVEIRDQLDNRVTSAASAVTLAIGTNPAGGGLNGTTTQNAVAGVASFPGLSIDKSGAGYTLTAGAGGLGGATSAAFTITGGAVSASLSTVVAAPATITASGSSTVTVTVRDVFGNPVSGATVVLAATGSGNSVTQPAGPTDASGVATGTLSSTGAGAKTVSAIAGGVVITQTALVTVDAGLATQLAFTTEPPAGTPAGSPMTPAVQVAARDAFGNAATGFTGPISVAMGSNPTGAILSGTTTGTAVAGVATFADLSINRAGAGYALTATATGLSGATSPAFTITPGPATHLACTVPPSNTVAGATIAPPVQVIALDAFDNVATGYSGSVTAAIEPSGGGGLSGTITVTAAAGVATFSNLSANNAGSYTLVVSAPGLGSVTCGPFNVTAAAPSTLAAISGDAQTDTIGGTLVAPYVVRVVDPFGNAVSGVTVIWAVTGGGGSITPGSVTDATGHAQATRVVGNALGAQTATASVGGLAGSPVSFTATATLGNPSQLAFTVQPGNAAAGTAIAPPAQVTVRDRLGNTATGFTGDVTVAIGTNPAGGTLSGTTTAAAAAGVATFPNLSVDKSGAGYTLTAAAAALTGTTSAPFTITASTVSAGPSTVTAAPGTIAASTGASPSTITVTARDAFGNPVAGVAVVLAATGGGNTITQPVGPTNASGVATGTISSTAAGLKTVSATAAGVAITQTAGVTVDPAPAVSLAFTLEPGTTVAGAAFSPTVQVAAWDAFGNIATGFNGSITVAIGTNPPGTGALDGTTSVAAVAGVATFPGLNIDEAGVGYTLTAAAPGLTGATSGPFTVTVGPAAAIAFVSGNAQSDTIGATLAAPYVVRVTDSLGNAVSGVTVTWAVIGGGSITPTSVTGATGEALANRVLGNTAGAQGATASVSGLTGSPVAFSAAASPGNPSQLAFAVQPVNTQAGVSITPAVSVTARDRGGNATTGFSENVTVAIGANPGSGTLSGTTTNAAVAGVATFPSLSVDRTGTGYALTAAATGLTGATSDTFTITPGPATQLAFTVEPSSSPPGATIAPVQVTAHDALGNAATGFTESVTITLGTNPGGGTLSGTTTVAATAGVATFATLSINTVADGYTLAASAAGLTGATSASFNIVTVISATLSTLTSGSDTIGQCLKACAVGLDASRITVTVRDAGGNPLPGVTVTLDASPADSVLFVNPGASGVTNGSGVFATDFRSVRAVSRTISAVAGSVTLAQTATVHVMPVLVGAGDMTTCTAQSDDAVADLLDSIPGTVFTIGDNAYDHGTDAEFANCYDPTWGRHKARTRPVAGNRDYDTPGATGYYAYFGAAANPSAGTGNQAGYYSYDVGGWHVVALNSEVATASNSAQMAWLLQDLNGRAGQCVIAMWHKPMFASSSGGSGSAVPLWQVSADSGVEIVLNGHSHVYERLVPLDASGNPSATGARTFIVGTGGIGLGGFATDPPYSAVRDKTTHGVLRLVLYPDRYRWQFIPAPGFGSFTDSGSAPCN